jgi:hypothetical protein
MDARTRPAAISGTQAGYSPQGVLVEAGELAVAEHNLAVGQDGVDAVPGRAVDDVGDRVAQLIVPTGSDHSYLLRERQAGACMVFVDRQPRLLDADAVISDNQAGAISAVNHLLAASTRRTAPAAERPAPARSGYRPHQRTRQPL